MICRPIPISSYNAHVRKVSMFQNISIAVHPCEKYLCHCRPTDPEGTVNCLYVPQDTEKRKICVRVSVEGDEVIGDHACVSVRQPGA